MSVMWWIRLQRRQVSRSKHNEPTTAHAAAIEEYQTRARAVILKQLWQHAQTTARLPSRLTHLPITGP